MRTLRPRRVTPQSHRAGQTGLGLQREGPDPPPQPSARAREGGRCPRPEVLEPPRHLPLGLRHPAVTRGDRAPQPRRPAVNRLSHAVPPHLHGKTRGGGRTGTPTGSSWSSRLGLPCRLQNWTRRCGQLKEREADRAGGSRPSLWPGRERARPAGSREVGQWAQVWPGFPLRAPL